MSDIDNNLSSSGNFSCSILLKEEFDEASEPTPEEIRDYAIRIGIDPERETHLLHIAREGLMQALPADWKPCFDEATQAYYYINEITKKTQWEHPLDLEYKRIVEKARRRHADLSAENISELDSGIRSLQGNEEGGDTTPESAALQMKVEHTIFQPPGGGPLGLRSAMGGNRDRIQLAPLSTPVPAAPPPTARFRKFEVTRAAFEPPSQISLSMNTAEKPPIVPVLGSQKVESPAKKGFTLMGGGNAFLKSNPRPTTASTSRPIDIERPRDLGGASGSVKGILRDSSLSDFRLPDDDSDRKFVRFNLESAVIKDSSPESAEKTSDGSTPENEGESEDDEEEEENWDFEGSSPHVKQVKVTPVISPISHATQLKILQSGNHASETIKKNETVKKSVVEKPSLFGIFDKGGAGRMYENASNDESEDEDESLKMIKMEKKKPEVAPFELEMAEEYKNLEQILMDEREKMQKKLETLKENNRAAMEADIRREEARFRAEMEAKLKVIEEKHLQEVLDSKKEAEAKLTEIKMGIKQQNEEELERFRAKLQDEFEDKRKQISDEYRRAADILQKNHAELLEELERDLKMEQEIIKKEHSKKLADTRASLEHEIEVEKQKMRESGEDRLYEKVRCEKRLLEDKYRCLKEKYMKLKNDIRISMERKKGQKQRASAAEPQSITTTGSERTPSNENARPDSSRPPMGIVSSAKQQLQLLETPEDPRRKNKHLKFVTHNDDTTTSISDTTISNQYVRGRTRMAQLATGENNNSDSEALNSEVAANNNNVILTSMGRQKRRVFTRSKSASTSRLHMSLEAEARPCTPVENLRTQLQKLEDLEDQFPENTLDTPYRLRYPFSDIGNQGGGSSELEFFKHRIHLEKDSVRRAKESLRSQRTNFRVKQREIKTRHSSAQRHTMDQLILEEKELTEMEVSLHRTRALLGEKVIRLRHLESSLQRLYEKERPIDLTDIRKDETLSDVSSHSSSGFSSTDFHTDNASQKKDLMQESSEIIQSLENLNAEIREIWDILSKQQSHGLPPPPPIEAEIKWTMFGAGNQTTTCIPSLSDRLETYRHITGRNTNPFLTSATSATVANTIVSQAPLAAHYTTSLVERTRDLRNWLKQVKSDTDTGGVNPLGQQTTI